MSNELMKNTGVQTDNDRGGMSTAMMILSFGLMGLGAYLVMAAVPDIKRYLRMRAM